MRKEVCCKTFEFNISFSIWIIIKFKIVTKLQKQTCTAKLINIASLVSSLVGLKIMRPKDNLICLPFDGLSWMFDEHFQSGFL